MVASGREDLNPKAVKITAVEMRRSLRESIVVEFEEENTVMEGRSEDGNGIYREGM